MRVLALLLVLTLSSAAQSPDSPPALADPPGLTSTVTVSTVAQLNSAIAGLVSNRKIVINPGTYTLSAQLWIDGNVDNCIIRGATGNRADVVIQGLGMTNPAVPHGFEVANGTNITFADLSVGNVYYHPFQLHGDGATSGIRIYNCRIFDAGEQFVKGSWNSVPGNGIDNGAVEYCDIEYTTTAPSDYTNGVDIHNGDNWVIRHCRFRNIRAPAGGGLAGPAVLMWNGCTNTIVEGNTFINCQRGISLGLVDASGAIPNDHVGGIVRNNVIYRGASQSGDVGIYISDCPGAKVINNTIILSGTYGTPIEYRFASTTGTEIRNNLLDGTIWARDGATGTLTSNLTSGSASMLVNAAAEDFHLAATATAAIDAGTPTPDCTNDWDLGARPGGAAYDIGHDELGGSSPPPPPPPAPPPSTGGGGGSSHRSGCGGGPAASTAALLATLALLAGHRIVR